MSMMPASLSGASGRSRTTTSQSRGPSRLQDLSKTLPARHVWDVIMASTYDFAEPGFVLIDQGQ